MPIELTDIIVPVIPFQREGDTTIDHRCTLCDETVGYDYHLRPEPHRLDECLGRLKEKVATLTVKID